MKFILFNIKSVIISSYDGYNIIKLLDDIFNVNLLENILKNIFKIRNDIGEITNYSFIFHNNFHFFTISCHIDADYFRIYNLNSFSSCCLLIGERLVNLIYIIVCIIQIYSGNELKPLKIEELNVSQQNDGVSCSLYSVYYAEMFSIGNLDSIENEMNNIREYFKEMVSKDIRKTFNMIRK